MQKFLDTKNHENEELRAKLTKVTADRDECVLHLEHAAIMRNQMVEDNNTLRKEIKKRTDEYI